ncbi:MAG TPA: MerR family transcriptional regulator [Ramlibacter sp.]|jgi:methanogenic corrinoid protein MtbC1
MDEKSAGDLPISAVERDTGLSKDTLRVWERRYGFPVPVRNALGERAYPPGQVDKLRVLKRLLDAGHRPGKLVALDLETLQRLGHGPATAGAFDGLDTSYLDLLLAHDVTGLRRQLHQALLGLGLERFITEHVAPMNMAVGTAWMQGTLSVAQEHVYTEALQLVLRQAIGSVPEAAADAPRALLATLPPEDHGLGLLMAEALLSLHGCHCLPLGVRVPMEDVVRVAALARVDLVALGFSSNFNPQQALAALAELRRRLPAHVALWAGGSNAGLRKTLPPGVQAIGEIGAVPRLLKTVRPSGGGVDP